LLFHASTLFFHSSAWVVNHKLGRDRRLLRGDVDGFSFGLLAYHFE
jgi:hypothetical protein